MQSTKSLFVLIPTIVLSLASCRTAQQTAVAQQQSLRANAERQEQQIHRLQQQVSLLQSQMIHQQQEANRRTEANESDVSETVIEEYDTSLPVDSTAGTPPLKSRRTERRDRRCLSVSTEAEHRHTEQQTDRQWEVQQAEQDSLTAQSNVERETESETDTRQHTGLTWWQTTLCTLGATALIILLVWIALKILKRYLKPF